MIKSILNVHHCTEHHKELWLPEGIEQCFLYHKQRGGGRFFRTQRRWQIYHDADFDHLLQGG